MSLSIGIITPTLNQAHFIVDTIESVQKQDFPSWEHIVIDGGSNDGTVEILKKYPHLRWVSEPDNGQSCAINKGMKLTQCDIITWINSDDYFDLNVFKGIANAFEQNPSVDFVYGDITYVDEKKRIRGAITGACLSRQSLSRNPDLVRQPSTFFRRSAWERIGGLREDLDLVFDFDFFLKGSAAGSFFYVPNNISFYRDYATTKTSRMQHKQAIEILRVALANRALTPRLVWFAFLRLADLEKPYRGLMNKFRKR